MNNFLQQNDEKLVASKGSGAQDYSSLQVIKDNKKTLLKTSKRNPAMQERAKQPLTMYPSKHNSIQNIDLCIDAVAHKIKDDKNTSTDNKTGLKKKVITMPDESEGQGSSQRASMV